MDWAWLKSNLGVILPLLLAAIVGGWDYIKPLLSKFGTRSTTVDVGTLDSLLAIYKVFVQANNTRGQQAVLEAISAWQDQQAVTPPVVSVEAAK